MIKGFKKLIAVVPERNFPFVGPQHVNRIKRVLRRGDAEIPLPGGRCGQSAVIRVVRGDEAGAGGVGGAFGHGAAVTCRNVYEHAILPQESEDLSKDLILIPGIPVVPFFSQAEVDHVSPEQKSVLQRLEADR